jgi:DNA invertase Pin-like site-specific DNA recombinase
MVRGVVIVYARGPESNALADYAARRGWEDIHVASDLTMVMRAVRAGKVEVLLASGLRGLGRSLSQLAATVRELAERGVGLCIPSLGIVDAGSRQTLLNTMCCVLESRAAIATERTTHGLARAKRRGVKLGRPRILDVHRGEVARLRAAGMSGREIAKELGFSPRSVFNVLRRSRYKVQGAGSQPQPVDP